MTISIEQAQANLPELINRLGAGEDMVITKDGKPVARIVRENGSAGARPPRVPGSAKADILRIAEDFDAPLDDFREYME
jgi:antitoxin (DNA-binding transcriptional repressor) of toxin-antitoxin stability system